MNSLRALSERLRLHLPLNKVFYTYWLSWFLLLIGLVWVPASQMTKAAIMGAAIAPLMIGIAAAEITFLFQSKGWKEFWRRLGFGFWCQVVLLALLMIVIAYVQAPENGWGISAAIGSAIGLIVPLHGRLSNRFYKRMIKQGSM